MTPLPADSRAVALRAPVGATALPVTIPPVISLETVRKIARLAKLDLSDAQIERMSADLTSILDLVDQIPELPGVAADESAGCSPLRDDEVKTSLPAADVLMNAPAATHDLFSVPRILGGSGTDS